LHAPNRCAELVAASAAERMVLPGEPVPSASDIEHTVKYASLVCRSPEAAEKFISLAETVADDLLRPDGAILIVLATVLKIRRAILIRRNENIFHLLDDFEEPPPSCWNGTMLDLDKIDAFNGSLQRIVPKAVAAAADYRCGADVHYAADRDRADRRRPPSAPDLAHRGNCQRLSLQ
jgi:hypothetical protein